MSVVCRRPTNRLALYVGTNVSVAQVMAVKMGQGRWIFRAFLEHKRTSVRVNESLIWVIPGV